MNNPMQPIHPPLRQSPDLSNANPATIGMAGRHKKGRLIKMTKRERTVFLRHGITATVMILYASLVHANNTSTTKLYHDNEISIDPGLESKYFLSTLKEEALSVFNAFMFVSHSLGLVCRGDGHEDDWGEHYQENGLPIDHIPDINPSDDWTLADDSFRYEDIESGEISPLYWESDGSQVDDDLRLVGLPPELTEEIENFCEETGLLENFLWAAYDSDLKVGESVMVNGLPEGHKWAIRRADFGKEEEDANLHWFDVIDELTFEKTMEVLEKGNFDAVLETIAEEFSPDGYMIAGMGFMVATHSVRSRIHSDNTGGGRDFFNLVVPIVLPEPYAAQLYIGDVKEEVVAPLTFEYDTGVLVSADTPHGTADCDYRRSGAVRVFASIYIADLNEKNIDVIAGDGTALFPVPDQTEWLLAQRGRFWGGRNGGSLYMDFGREPFTAKDEWQNCTELAEEGMCEPEGAADLDEDDSPWRIRLHCQKSCDLFIDDEVYQEAFRSEREEFEQLQYEEDMDSTDLLGDEDDVDWDENYNGDE